MLAETNSRNICGDFLKLAPVFVARLHVPRVHLARPTRHPQQDAMPAPTRVLVQLFGERRQPPAHAHSTSAKRHRLKHSPPINQIHIGHSSTSFAEYSRQ